MSEERDLPRVHEVSALLGLEELLERKPAQLSGGQRQRVAMGRALARRPQAFLLDEPLSNLDAKLRTQLRAELKKIHQLVPTTSIYVTHDQVEAMTLGDRIAVMAHGRIQQLGVPQDVYDEPANLFVAGFIGSPRDEPDAGRCQPRRARRRPGADPRPRAGRRTSSSACGRSIWCWRRVPMTAAPRRWSWLSTWSSRWGAR